MLNTDTFLYIKKIVESEKSLYDIYHSMLLSAEDKREKDGLKKILDQHKSRYNALISLLKEDIR